MTSTVTLQNGDSYETDEEPQELAERFDTARSDGTLCKVYFADGSVWINPHALVAIVPIRPSVSEDPLVG